jgi:hypothetical protein
MTDKFYYQAVTFITTALILANIHGQRTIISSSKAHQMKDKSLQIDMNLLGDADVYYFFGLVLGAY